tara:strand:+ start:3269 stop:3664 length:396 start_codon:yes stop_codon:yes gene_type:complete
MNTEVIVEDKSGNEVTLRRPTVEDMINFGEVFYQRERKAKLQDMKDAELTPEVRAKELAELSEKRGLASHTLKYAFVLENACFIIKRVADQSDYEKLMELSADSIVEVALRVLGFDLDILTDKEGEDTDPT